MSFLTSRDGTEFGYLPLHKTRTDGTGDRISMSEFRIWAQRIRAHQTLFVLDSCFSGNALPAVRSTRAPSHKRYAERADFVFTSSASGQESYGYRDGSGGLFTRAFLSAQTNLRSGHVIEPHFQSLRADRETTGHTGKFSVIVTLVPKWLFCQKVIS